MQLIIFEDEGYKALLPLVYSRCTFNLRCGFNNLLEKLEATIGRTAESLFVRKQLAPVIAERQPRRVNQPATSDDQLWINGRFLIRGGIDLPLGSASWQGESLVAARIDRAIAARLQPDALMHNARIREVLGHLPVAELPPQAGVLIEYPWQLVLRNAEEVQRQFAAVEPKLLSEPEPGAHLVEARAIHVGEGCRIRAGAVLDASSGPIFIGANVIVHPCAVIQGPCFIGDGCVIQPGASIRSGCSIGMVCKVGGEVEGTIFHGYSNKQHDGFIGHSYIGEWVNLGADTVGSDLKNTYGPVRVPINGTPVDTGETFVGAFIGDHTKTAIRTTLPTGCVIGYGCNIATSSFAPTFLPSFSWLTDTGRQGNDPQKALAVARTVMSRRNRTCTPAETALFLSIQQTAIEHESVG